MECDWLGCDAWLENKANTYMPENTSCEEIKPLNH